MFGLHKLLDEFNKLDLTTIIGIEWECYLLEQKQPLKAEKLALFFKKFLNIAKNQNIFILNIEKEQGQGQIEIKTRPYQDISKLCQDFILIKKIVQEISKTMSLETDFAAQKYHDDCGSALQINLNFLDQKQNNLFAGSSENESKLLLYSIAGILSNISKFLENYISCKEDMKRFDKNLNINLHKSGKYTAPINFNSWGYNNRTTTIRIAGSNRTNNRRLEFRVPCSNANITQIIESLLYSVLQGIKEEELPQNAIYGNCF